MTSQPRTTATTSPSRAAARGLRFVVRRGARRPAPVPRRVVPPVERASGWLVALAVVAGAVLFSVLAMNAFLGG